MKMPSPKSQPAQPASTDDWGVPFYGRAKTLTGDFWWYEQDGKRRPLKPANVVCEKPTE